MTDDDITHSLGVPSPWPPAVPRCRPASGRHRRTACCGPARPASPADAAAHRDAWTRGLSRRTFLARVGIAGAAALGAPLVTARASFGQPGATGTLVVVFLRGGMDGLSVVVPAGDPHLAAARPRIAVPPATLLPLDRGFGLHPALAPLHPLWGRGQLAAVHGVSTPDVSRSHFQAQDCLERGGSSTGTAEGWLDRVLDAMGPGTTFRSLTVGATVTRSLAGDQPTLSLTSLEWFTARRPRGRDRHAHRRGAGGPLHRPRPPARRRGGRHPRRARAPPPWSLAQGEQPAATYPEGEFPETAGRARPPGQGRRGPPGGVRRRRRVGHAHQPRHGRRRSDEGPAHDARRGARGLRPGPGRPPRPGDRRGR